MTVIADYSLPAGDIFLGRAVTPDAEVELERLFGEGDTAVSYFWVHGDRCTEFEQSLSDLDGLVGYESIDDFGNRQFYRGNYEDDSPSLVSGVFEFDGVVFSARGNHERWGMRVAFRSGDIISEFQRYCIEEAGVELELDNLYNPVDSSPRPRTDLTPRQRETLLTAYEEGYFDIPREVTLVELADRLDVSDQAVSERLRRGESKLIRTHLLDD